MKHKILPKFHAVVHLLLMIINQAISHFGIVNKYVYLL
jgi:hypothetical protein